jgi:CheY-like chemotaxis protein
LPKKNKIKATFAAPNKEISLKNRPVIIFLADDDEDDTVLFQEAVEKCGISAIVTVFQHGRQVCDHIEHDLVHPDIIFLDINMPLMNGKDCLKQIRRNAQFDDVPVVMYSFFEQTGSSGNIQKRREPLRAKSQYLYPAPGNGKNCYPKSHEQGADEHS